MAFHVACPITCRRICYCELGFPRKLQKERGKEEFLGEVSRIEEFIKDPWLLKAEANATVQVKVPKVVVVAPPVPPPPPIAAVQRAGAQVVPASVVPPVADGGGGGTGAGAGAAVGDGDEAASAQTKRVALQKQAAAASMVAEDFARRFESGEMVGPVKDDAQEEQGLSNVKVMCRLCFSGESEGSERARKMLPCKSCGKKYHRSCLKAWSQHRDLFHWSSWTCPSCRICEVCRRSGDPNKFMFCKRCDGAFHCYCQQPPHKNVSNGPYLCPKHTKCHSCGSSVPGNGLSVRWFLGYTCCDACGRLFVKGNYCPVCLKVYRDSESTPMVCCDVCQRWVHCQCDGISDAKYLQFQVDGNLQYVCPTCRGECYQVKNLEEAVQELWRRRDEADRDLIANLRAAAGLPTQQEIFSISPFSDDEENAPVVMKNEYGRSLRFSLKGVVDKSPKKSKEYGKKSSNKKSGKKKGHLMSIDSVHEAHQNFERHDDASSFGYDNRTEQVLSSRSGEPDGYFSPVAGSVNDGMCSVNQAGVLKHKFIDEVTASHNNRAHKTVKIKSNKPQGGGLDNGDDSGNQSNMSRATKGPKLVIHIGSRNRNLTTSPRSDGSSYQKDQDMTTSNGSEDVGQPRKNESVHRQENASKHTDGKATVADQKKGSKLRGKDGNLIKIKKANTEAGDMPPKFGGAKLLDEVEQVSGLNTRALGKKSTEVSATGVRIKSEFPASRTNRFSSVPAWDSRPGALADVSDDGNHAPISNSQKESKPLLKLKFKNPISENQSTWAPPKEDERSSVKGQRSKRKRPSPPREKVSTKNEDDASRVYGDRSMDEIMDANWILQKLGKDAMGKRVEVHQPSDNSWHRGTVTEVFEGTSFVSVALDNGKAKNLELGKQGIRFISQKHKRQ
ncbi:uncharacterized protein [Coffea arabica]|uniref:Histone-lysine N-methyltransferase 2C-like n=1 Tax=Coffea arabica TaxID=13443 RepID=A0A6P6VYB6_COFAR|nr:uncharacterized protein LOC113727092 [Coffea arabica]